MRWTDSKNISKEELVKARKQIHQAVQLTAMTGRCLNPKDTGDSFAALTWDEEHKALSSKNWKGSKFRSALRISAFELVIFDENGTPINSFTLNRKTYNEAFNWMSESINDLGFDSNKLNKSLPYEIPVYPTASGEPFSLTDLSAFTEIQKYYSNANYVLQNIKGTNPGASEIRCWPHHFDIAMQISVDKNNGVEKTIGLGLSPGDESYNEPYFYISPWPYPEDLGNLPPLIHGAFWNTENWVGVVFTSEAIIKLNTGQEKITLDVVNNAIDSCKKLFNL